MQHAQHANQHGWRARLSRFVQHMRDSWPATIFVAAAFSLLDLHIGWLDGINGYAFVAIGNLAGVPQASGERSAKALVVLIDQAAAESRYFDRSPLDRCRLREDLATVYSAMDRRNQRPDAQRLDILVVDLDLSPARWLETAEGAKTEEPRCELELHQLIAGAYSKWQIRTVLMNPFDAVDARLKEAQRTWRKKLEDEKSNTEVKFGRATLPVEYGLVIKQYCDPDTLAASAYALAKKSSKSRKSCIDDVKDPSDRSRRESQHIDPRKYLSAVVPIAIGATHDFGTRLDSTLGIDQPSNAADNQADFRAVFFGAAFGEGDTFVTPLGELYGVEIHAAGFLSWLEPISANNRLPELLADIVFGFLFGFLIALCWKWYFRLRLSKDSDLQLSAPIVLVFLGAGVGLVALMLTYVSWRLLAGFGIWASPIPMAIGMLIESFASGPVAQGVREAQNGGAEQPPLTFRESAKKFFGGEFRRFLNEGKNLSAALVAVGLVVWTGVVVLALLP